MRIEGYTQTTDADVKPEPPPPPPPVQKETEVAGLASKNGEQAQQAQWLRAKLLSQETGLVLGREIGAIVGAIVADVTKSAPAQPAGRNTADYWRNEALRSAGIDPATWDPSKGFRANAGNVAKVYQYYTQLYLKHPELQWAGMAKMAGGTVLAGLEEIYAIRNAASVGASIPTPLSPLAKLAEGDLSFMENKLLEMQKAIFTDLAWQHEAYAQGGIQTIRDLHANGQLSDAELRVWEDVASGNQTRIENGNKSLLLREQHDILIPYYDQINSHGFAGVEGKLMSVALSLLAESPIPGGRAFRDVVHHKAIQVGPIGIGPDLPGDITNFDDRWKWITEDMLPRWQEMNRNNPAEARAQVSSSLQDLANRNLLKQGESILNFVRSVLPPYLPF